eukprot:TRINITY_DN22780_c0_g1_i1.p1 TRINITY_DN22780_c0_g1~~TRINITY_DN22780_c0_g1_i1.p1  ORF type:complete len:501 (-),score=101.36 TRINITY_DN22780_c0_g1_i1:235-1710(-)
MASSKRKRTDGTASASTVNKGNVVDNDSSKGLSRLLGSDLNVDQFFSSVWEVSPRLLREASKSAQQSTEKLKGLLPLGDLLAVLEHAEPEARDRPLEVSLLNMKESCPTSEYPSSYAAYLGGCSVIINHLDKVYQPVQQLCQELREELLHVFVNMYLTPPQSQAVAPHADDRDVIVIQVSGSKKWKVYADPPVPFPYPSEQVGKSDAYPVPEHTLDKPLMEVTLHEGDVLYMPRGFVHEAFTSEDEASLHLTLALATHDWSYASVVSEALRASGETSEFCSSYRERAEREEKSANHASWWLRRSLCPAVLGSSIPSAVRDIAMGTIESAAKDAKETLSAADVISSLSRKIAVHNQRQDSIAAAGSFGTSSLELTSYVRRLHAEEKLETPAESQQQGLSVRHEIGELIMQVLNSITTAPVQISEFADGPLLCPFTKICFAAVLMDLGVLCLCDSDGNLLRRSATCRKTTTTTTAAKSVRRGKKKQARRTPAL